MSSKSILALQDSNCISCFMAWVRCLIKPGGCSAAAPGTNRYGNPTLGCVGLKAGNVEREEGDVSSAWRGAWRYSWPTELGAPSRRIVPRRAPPEIGRGSRARQCASPVPFCFAHKQVVAAVVGSQGSRQSPTLLPQPMAKGGRRGGEREEEGGGMEGVAGL